MIYYLEPEPLNTNKHLHERSEYSYEDLISLIQEIDICFDFDLLNIHSKKIMTMYDKLKYHIKFTNNDNLKKIYKIRFLLNCDNFLKLQSLVAPIHSETTHPLIPSPEHYFNFLFETTKKKLITKNYKESVSNFYVAAKKSENLTDLSNNELNDLLSLILLEDYQIFHSYGAYMQNFHQFVSFCKHYVAFNFAKDFLQNPNINNVEFFGKCLHLIDFEKNSIPSHKEFDLLIQLFEQKHWDVISSLTTSKKFEVLNKTFFWNFPLPNSSSPFSFNYKNKDDFHFLKYPNLSSIHNKFVILNDLFDDKNNSTSNMEQFINNGIEKRKNSKNHDSDGIEFLQEFIKKYKKLSFYHHLKNKISDLPIPTEKEKKLKI